ncbi:enoyl-CoA hydratase/isomerase family protein [Actinomadura rugatobispora]|uniref:Enoyl-CoA hydratase/isomerase family protein n=1 Tax=Actinomadura rugatobispora TaxID=1994 RepID=A0ABW0ZV75_9ACTN|nr:enoyl-CoA hydratase-related protein [Actinomadura rugatobispora]
MAYVTYEKEGRIAVITLRRPDRRNALGRDLCRDLRAAYEAFENDTDVAVGILTGEGNFCAGRDIKETRWDDPEGPHDAGFPSPDLFYYSRLTKPLISAVNSYAFGGGMLLALAFPDLVICAESAVFELSEVQRSLLGAWELGWNLGLPRAVAMEVALGYRMSGRRAHELGLANAVVPDDQLMDTAREWAQKLLVLPPAIIRRHRELLRKHADRPMSTEVKELWERYWDEHMHSVDFDEGDRAFLEKREAKYRTNAYAPDFEEQSAKNHTGTAQRAVYGADQH